MFGRNHAKQQSHRNLMEEHIMITTSNILTIRQAVARACAEGYSISDYAKSAVFAMYEKGIALGTGDGSFAPLRNATRAEAAVIIYRLLKYIE